MTNLNNLPDILTVRQAADLLGIHDSTLRYALLNGRLKGEKEILFTVEHWIIRKEDLIEAIESGRIRWKEDKDEDA